MSRLAQEGMAVNTRDASRSLRSPASRIGLSGVEVTREGRVVAAAACSPQAVKHRRALVRSRALRRAGVWTLAARAPPQLFARRARGLGPV